MGEPGQHNEKTKKNEKVIHFFHCIHLALWQNEKTCTFFSFDILIIQDELRGIPKCTVSLCSTAPQGTMFYGSPRPKVLFFSILLHWIMTSSQAGTGNEKSFFFVCILIIPASPPGGMKKLQCCSQLFFI